MPSTSSAQRPASKSIARLALRVISGPNSGAEMALRPGVYVLGRARGCDIVLHDEALADHHLKLWIKGSNILVEPLADAILISGIRIERNAVALRTYRRVKVGNSVFAVGELGKPWPQDVFSDVEDDGNDALKSAWIDGNNRTQKAPAGRGKTLEQLFAQWIPRIALVLVALALIAVLGNAIRGSRSDDLVAPEAQGVKGAIEQLRLSDSVAVRNRADGQIEVIGFVDEATQLKSLRQTLDKTGAKFIYRVQNTRDLAGSAEVILRAIGIPYVTAEPGNSGEIVMKGFVDQESNWRKALAILQDDLPAGISFNDQGVSTLAARAESLRQMVAESALKSKLEVTINDSQLEISGALSNDDTPHLRALREEFRSRYGEFPRLTDNIKESGQRRFELQIKAVSMGLEPFIELKSGKKLTVGSVLDSGMKIDSISTKEIATSKGDLKMNYAIGDR